MVEVNRTFIKEVCFKASQFGVAVAGGADGLIHFRVELEMQFQLSPTAIAAIDVDFKNAFPSFEWDSIRRAVSKHVPKLLAWTEWCHADASLVYLPSGSSVCQVFVKCLFVGCHVRIPTKTRIRPTPDHQCKADSSSHSIFVLAYIVLPFYIPFFIVHHGSSAMFHLHRNRAYV